MPNRGIWTALLVALLPLGLPAAHAQTRKYTIEDLQALASSQSWDEASQHLEDVPPARRDDRWKLVVEKTAIGQMRAFDLDHDPLGGLVLADTYTKRFNHLSRSRSFMQARAEIGLKGFERCFVLDGAHQTCTDRLLPFVERDKGNVALATKAAQLQTKNAYSYWGAALWRLAAEWSKGSKEVCTAYLASESTLAALDLPPSHEMVEPAKRVADLCFPYLKTSLQKKVGFGDQNARENVCPLLRRKKAIGGARCSGT